MERFAWIEGGAVGRLASFLHLPDKSGPHPAVLFCHGFTGSRVEPQRLFLNFSRRLALIGVASLCFDFGGHGESEGDFSQMTLDGEIRDARAAWCFLCSIPEVDTNRMGLLGFSLGGWVAVHLASGLPKGSLKALALWAPVDDPDRLKIKFMGLHGSDRLHTDGGVDVMAERLNHTFAEGLERYSGQLPGEGWSGPTLLIHGAKDQSVPPKALDRYETAFKSRGCLTRRIALPGARHLFETPAHRAALYHETETFFRGVLNA